MAKDWWRDDKRWRDGRIASGARSSALVLFALGGVTLGLAAPGTLAIPEELDQGNVAILAVLLFDIIGLGFWLGALREALAWRKFGEIYAVLVPFPGQLGGSVSGYFELAEPLPQPHQIQLQLRCMQRYRGHKNTVNRPVWTEDLDLADLDAHARQIWFSFTPPADLPASEPEDKRFHYWELNLKVSRPGPDLDRTFTIPVFAGGKTSALATRRMTPDPAPAERRLRQFMQLREKAGRVELRYAPGRNLSLGLGLLVFGLITLASAAFVGQLGLFGGLMATVFAVCGLPLSLAGVWVLGRRMRVRFSPGEVAARVFWMGIPVYTRRLRTGADSRWQWRRSGASQGRRAQVMHDLQLVSPDGARPLTVGSGFASADQARDAAAVLARAAGLPGPTTP